MADTEYDVPFKCGNGDTGQAIAPGTARLANGCITCHAFNMFIRIVQRPDGEAPEWVRDAWIGTVLPLSDAQAVTSPGFGVVTGPKTIWGEWWLLLTGRSQRFEGYTVCAADAVNILAGQNPDAADWWRSNVAYMLDGRHDFLFDVPACVILPD